MTLTEFLLARIAEDEGYANKASAGRWKMWGMTVMADTFGDSNFDHCAEVARTIFVDDHGKPRTWNGLHITKWGPARVLAECEAKRRIVGEHSPIGPGVNIDTSGYAPKDGPVCGCCGEPEWGCVAWPCLTLRALALPFADHPDFDPAWRIS